MEQKVKADQIPAQAHLLYVKLYCERKGVKNKNTIQEAKKSWTSLNPSKKKLFYKTTANRNLLKYANDLRKTKTYLKEKVPKLNDKSLHEQQLTNEEQVRNEQQETIQSINESYLTDTGSRLREENDFIHDKTQNNTKLEDTNETQLFNIGSPAPQAEEISVGTRELISFEEESLPNQGDEIENASDMQSDTSSIRTVVIPIAEPAPPTVKIGKDLYEVVQRPEMAEWSALTRKDRSYYNSAVRAIKREYIKNYKKYLESLPQQQLYDHYIKTISK